MRDLEVRAKARVTADADQDAEEIQRVYARKKAALQEQIDDLDEEMAWALNDLEDGLSVIEYQIKDMADEIIASFQEEHEIVESYFNRAITD